MAVRRAASQHSRLCFPAGSRPDTDSHIVTLHDLDCICPEHTAFWELSLPEPGLIVDPVGPLFVTDERLPVISERAPALPVHDKLRAYLVEIRNHS